MKFERVGYFRECEELERLSEWTGEDEGKERTDRVARSALSFPMDDFKQKRGSYHG